MTDEALLTANRLAFRAVLFTGCPFRTLTLILRSIGMAPIYTLSTLWFVMACETTNLTMAHLGYIVSVTVGLTRWLVIAAMSCRALVVHGQPLLN